MMINPDSTVTSKESLYNLLDSYAYDRRGEIDIHEGKQGSGLVKSYVLETSHHAEDRQLDVALALRMADVVVLQLAEELFYIRRGADEIGYAEPVSKRHFVIHSVQKNYFSDRAIERIIRHASNIDALWLAGDAFLQILLQLIAPQRPLRDVRMKFEYRREFDFPPRLSDQIGWRGPASSYRDIDPVNRIHRTDISEGTANEPEDMDEEILGFLELGDVDSDEEEDVWKYEHRWTVAFNQLAQDWANNLLRYAEIDPHWRAAKMLSIPDSKRGGYDMWSWGKMLHHGTSFREGLTWLKFITDVYDKVTRAIEETVWFGAEPTRMGEETYQQLHGMPVVFTFSRPLTERQFYNFIHLTFRERRGPFRLWGNPIAMGSSKFHVYGIDRHLWQQLYMELTTRYFLFVLPKGTCGNTVHRLMTNIQRYLDPAVRLTIGDIDYTTMIKNALSGREVFGVGHQS